jgi:hypothetical protein
MAHITKQQQHNANNGRKKSGYQNGRNGLAKLRQSEGEAYGPPLPKAYASCKCHKEKIGSKEYFTISVHCSIHWTYGEQKNAEQKGIQTERGRVKRGGSRAY